MFWSHVSTKERAADPGAQRGGGACAAGTGACGATLLRNQLATVFQCGFSGAAAAGASAGLRRLAPERVDLTRRPCGKSY